MAHLPYADLSDAPLQSLLARIARERGSVLHLYQMLLHSPPLAEGWLGFLTQVPEAETRRRTARTCHHAGGPSEWRALRGGAAPTDRSEPGHHRRAARGSSRLANRSVVQRR